MSNYTARYISEFIEKNHLNIEEISEELDILKEKMILGTEESLSAEEFLRLCQYLHIRPEDVLREFEK